MNRAEFLKACLAAGVSFRALRAGTLPNVEELTITGLHRMYRNHEVSVSDVVDHYLTRIEKLDKFRAIAWINPRAREEARVQDEQLRKHGPTGTLFGVPVFAKANYDISGVPTTAANTTLSKTIPQPAPRDAAQVQRLKAAGAIILGKTNCDDFAFGGEGASTLYGQVLNPYDRTGKLSPGGSSAGASVAMTANFGLVAVGTDDGGSCRIPAQFNSIVGLKTIFGLVSRAGVFPTFPWIDAHGPLARTVWDVAMGLDAIAGPDPADIYSLACTGKVPKTYTAYLTEDALRGVRLGVIKDHLYPGEINAEVLELFHHAVGQLQSLGATVTEVDPPLSRQKADKRFFGSGPERNLDANPYDPNGVVQGLAEYYRGWPGDRNALIEKSLRAQQESWKKRPGPEIIGEALKTSQKDNPIGKAYFAFRDKLVAEQSAFLKQQNLAALIFPTLPFPPYDLKLKYPPYAGSPLHMADILGLPEISVPAGFTKEGLPGLNISIQGLPFEDGRILGFAYAFEQATHMRRPPTLPKA